ncbi:hypothetical protein COV06_03850 [Candidatus Uhrbacteria bacterium CG10_big_fil_rev_8_21_14_0_10_50_16]|uniref:NIF system FeS cluster assembly NifU C-terminal domain-containing protein n=1 Tax=Candidatus Uhrbacteria bacterium CG10_big_fil_rev_8_21_14_0_10_50_16 TaxID=1975039 RepID=A0A2H0RLT0_9BACT|nr:MAG: hypothetical protein COV06_03850 [Candidatus Uhrbacteria bacterium CG10_big_fil_rev_8_21_14_0_10_50_16]
MLQTLENKIEEVLETIRPRLALHAGNVEFLGFNTETGEVQVSLTGTCRGCPLSEMTLKMGIEVLLKEQVPEVRCVTNIYEHP